MTMTGQPEGTEQQLARLAFALRRDFPWKRVPGLTMPANPAGPLHSPQDGL
jgi:hypothetical protein